MKRNPSSAAVAADQTAMHLAIAAKGEEWHFPAASAWRSLSDIAFDWALIFLSVWATYQSSWIALPAILLIGNRQRALSNLMHEAAHQNLSARRSINDRLARIFIAPALFSSLALYRLRHAQHHARLGDPVHDPDFTHEIAQKNDHWYHLYARILASRARWSGSLMGHLAEPQLRWYQRSAMLLWWATCEAILIAISNLDFALLFISLWLIARGTAFHAITTFREMTDHYGLDPRGIFRYTRDIPDGGFLNMIFHPHHNGYHLTHHLFPSIPYCRLPDAHVRLRQIAFFNANAIVCDAYFNGKFSSIASWSGQS